MEWDALKEGLGVIHRVQCYDFKDIFVDTNLVDNILVGKVTPFPLQIIEDQLSLFLVSLSLPLISRKGYKQTEEQNHHVRVILMKKGSFEHAGLLLVCVW